MLSLSGQVTVSVVSALNIFRVRHLQRLYFLVDDLKFHSYHRVHYDGELRLLLDMILVFQQNMWVAVNVGALVDWLNGQLPISSYLEFTNRKFAEVEKTDSFFLQKTKDFFLLNVPFCLLSFLILNRLFRLLHKMKVSVLLRAYAFWLNIPLMLLVQNVYTLSFYACHHFMHVFSFDAATRTLQFLCIAVIGLMLIPSVSLFYLSRYFYGDLSKTFLSNLYRTEGAFTLMTVKFVLLPVVETSLHSYLFDSYSAQVLSLAVTNILAMLTLAGFELRYGIFRTKGQFVLESMADASIAALNLLLYLKHAAFPELSELIEEWVGRLLHILGIVVIVCALYSLVVAPCSQY